MKRIYCVGNAHLDPVWMWRWQEGSAEAKATIRSALDRMKEYPDFKFVCSSASVFEWIEEFAPEMFCEVRERVKEGRFVIVGGWFVQPDCNLPSGEGFARQSLYSQRYFHDRFGVTAESGYNVDSFGHNLMIPQILKKSGMKQYVFMRPERHENQEIPSIFRWRSPDGSEVPTFKIHKAYTVDLISPEMLDERIEDLKENMPNGAESAMFFYGVGNHGGGPTKQNIELISARRKTHPETELVFSSVSDFFDEISKDINLLPLYEDDLQHHASGCYSALADIKDGIRKAENALLAAESLNMTAAHLVKKPYLTKELEKAWKNVLFCHFHDIAGGCIIESAHKDAILSLNESLSVAARMKNSAHQTISWAVDTRNASKGYPIVIFNPLPFEVTQVVTINKPAIKITDREGKVLNHQYVKAECRFCYVVPNTIFTATVPAMGYSTYYYTEGETEEFPESPLSVWETGMENEHIRIEFEAHTGHVLSIYDKDGERELISGRGAIPTVIDEYEHDTWSHGKNFFTKSIAVFSDAEISIVEKGPVRAAIKVTNRYNDSTLTQIFSLDAEGKSIKVSAEIDWHERHKMLKLGYQTSLSSPSPYYEIPFGVIKRPADGEEEPGHRWVSLDDGENGFVILNSNKYSFSADGATLYLTVIRSPLYGDHGRPRVGELSFTDQGIHRFEYVIMNAPQSRRAEIIRAARVLGTPAENVLENNHEGFLPEVFEGISSNSDNVQISSFKRAENGNGYVLRIYETDGLDTDVTVSGSLLPVPLNAHITHYSVNTYLLVDGESKWKEVLMTEFDI